MRAHVVLFLSWLSLGAVAACGGGGGATDAPPKTAPTEAAPAEADADAPDLGAARDAFVTDCAKDQPGAEEYCGCAWDVARQTYGDDAVRARGTPTQDDLAKIHVRVAGQCAQHFPAALIERAFMAGCTKKQPELQQYCACSWTELAKKMPPGELVVERAKRTEKYQSAMHAAATACQKLRPLR